MLLIDPEKLEVNDVVFIKRLIDGNENFLIGRVADTDHKYKGERHIIIWGNWCEERRHASVIEQHTFMTHFSINEPGLQVQRLGKWVNGAVKNRESEACYILGNLLMELKSTGLIRVSSITETERFLRG